MTENSTRARTPVDIYVGRQIRERRIACGLSQEALADALGITFQQVQKYEIGSNRVTCGRLYSIGEALGCPPSAFFPSPDHSAAAASTPPARPRRRHLELIRQFDRMPNKAQRILIAYVRATNSAIPIPAE